MIRVTVDSVRVSLLTQNRVVVLREPESRRYLPIWIGQFEADAISFVLQNLTPKRPMTHDLLRTTIHELGGSVIQVLINDIQDTTFFARIFIQTNTTTLELDARSSDAIALALRADVPIYVAAHVMEQASVPFDNDARSESPLSSSDDDDIDDVVQSARESLSQTTETPNEPAVSDEDLSPFRDFINSLERKKDDTDKDDE